MGKKLVIKGADFSENAVENPTEELTLVNGATANWVSGYWNTAGTTGSAGGWYYVAAIDISQYVGKTMRIRSCNTSKNGIPRGTHGDWCWIKYADNTSEKLYYEESQQPRGIVNQTVAYGTFVVPNNASVLYMSVRAGSSTNYDITTSNAYLKVYE